MNALIKNIGPSGTKPNNYDLISLEGVNLKNSISKYHQITYFMSKIGKITK